MSALRFTATLALAILAYISTFVAYQTFATGLACGVGWGLFLATVILIVGLEP